MYFDFIACFDIQLNIGGEMHHDDNTPLKKKSTVRWKLGPCTSLNSIEGDTTYHESARTAPICSCLQARKMASARDKNR